MEPMIEQEGSSYVLCSPPQQGRIQAQVNCKIRPGGCHLGNYLKVVVLRYLKNSALGKQM